MNRKSTYYVRILAGGYLLYLGYSLVKSTLTEHLTKVYLAFGLVFAGLGLVIGGSALLAVHRIEKEEREGAGNQEHIYVSGGRRGAQMELGPEDFLRACGGKLADVCTHGDS